jgi:excinuclease ABC subunit A
MSVDQIIDAIYRRGSEGSRIMVMAPVALGRKGEYKKVLDDAKKAGYQRVRIDGEMHMLDESFALDKQVKHTISIVVDRLILEKSSRLRLADSIEKSTDMTGGLVEITYIGQDKSETSEIYSEQNSCPHCGISVGEVQPRLFSFNNPYGACPECNGLGFKTEYDVDKIIPDRSKSFEEGAIASQNPNAGWGRAGFEAFAKSHGFTLKTPFNKLTPEQFDAVLYGSDRKFKMDYEDRMGSVSINRRWHGVINDLKRRYAETESVAIRTWISSFQTEIECPVCHGERLRPEALSVFVGGKNINQATAMNIRDSYDFFLSLSLTENEQKIAFQIMKEIRSRLMFLKNVGLSYLTMNRNAGTLSGGEAQRIRLATQIGSALSGVLYVLDEPSIGLHQRDNQRLIDTLKNLRDIGNTVIVVEHDEATIRNADYVVDMGPGAGEHGGHVIAQGTPEEIEKNPQSITGQFLSGMISIPVPFMRRPGNGKHLKVIGATKNNLCNVDFDFPLGKLVVLTGVSGSGKSTLLNQILTPALHDMFNRKPERFDGYRAIEGAEYLDKLIQIDQSPIGKTPRSNPATYVGVWTHIRDLFASLPESKARGYRGGRFSFNVPGGRCEHCHGDGTIKIEMNFLPDVYVTCDVCHGKRFNQETLAVHYKGKSIADVLDMTVSEALEFFQAVPPIKRKLETLDSVGLGYIKLGQSALTLSGGEAQRVKLSLELSKIGTGKTLYVLDEPTTGLHFADIKKLMEVVDRLVESGNTVVMIEHNMDVIKLADHIIDLGPEGGDGGGHIVARGTPEEVALCKESHTGYYLKQVL